MNNYKKNKTSRLRQNMLMIYHDDGLLDLVVGFAVIMLSVVMAFEAVAFIGLIGIPLILYIPIKDRVSIPRMGRIRFEPLDVSRRKLFAFLFLGLAALLFFLFLSLIRIQPGSGLATIIRSNQVLVFALLLGGSLFAASYFLNNRRFAVYSILSLVLVLGLNVLDLRIWSAVLGVGLLMEAVGIYQLVGFLRDYPLISEE
jgi:hypothetical protein